MARKMSRKQLGALASAVNAEAEVKGDSGWSVRAYGPQAGMPARDSYMVAQPKAEVQERLVAPVTSRAIGRYQKKFKSRLTGPDIYSGGWVPKEGTGSQDVSEAYPRTEEGFKSAYFKGVMNRQRAIGDVGETEYEGDIAIPKHLRAAKRSTRVWSEGVEGDPMKPEVRKSNKAPNTIKIVPSKAEMAQVYAEETFEERRKAK